MTDTNTRTTIAKNTAETLRKKQGEIADRHVVIGFDGCIDTIVHVVDVRHGAGRYERMTGMLQFADRIAKAAGKSANIEFVVQQQKTGGNAAIMASALVSAGTPLTFIGNLADPSGNIAEVYRQFTDDCEEVILTGETGLTDAAEFNDGKVMFGKVTPFESLDYARLTGEVPPDRLLSYIDKADLLATVNWTMFPGMNDIWRGLLKDILPRLSESPTRRMFVDLADPAKRSKEDLAEALALLGELNSFLPLTLGLNLSEAKQVAQVLGLSAAFADNETVSPDTLLPVTVQIREILNIDRLLIHPLEGAAGAQASGEEAWFSGPYIPEPKISTGGGDHFNAGANLAALLGLSLQEQLAAGTATSGYYVRTAISPDINKLADFLDDMPAPVSG